MDRTTPAPGQPAAPAAEAAVLLTHLRRLIRAWLATTHGLRLSAKTAASEHLHQPFAGARNSVQAASQQTQPLALPFTDIKDSSGLYRRFGDAEACRIIRAHFEWLEHLVHRFGGVLIKTMGDGTLAAFGDGTAAIATALAAQAELEAFERPMRDPGLVLRLAVHAGPCIVTRAGGSFDCYGTTVNVAARLLRASEGKDMTISAAAADDPAARTLLAAHPHCRTELRMPNGQPVPFLRVILNSLPPARALMPALRLRPSH